MAVNFPVIMKWFVIAMISIIGVILGAAFLFMATLNLTTDQIIFLVALAAMALVAWAGCRTA
jgi:hypothetical protein